MELRVGAYSERLRVGAHGVELAMGVEFGAAHCLYVLEGGDGNKSRPASVAAAVADVEFRSRLLLQTRRDGARYSIWH